MSMILSKSQGIIHPNPDVSESFLILISVPLDPFLQFFSPSFYLHLIEVLLLIESYLRIMKILIDAKSRTQKAEDEDYV